MDDDILTDAEWLAAATGLDLAEIHWSDEGRDHKADEARRAWRKLQAARAKGLI